MSRDFKLYLDDILAAAKKVILYTADFSFDQFTDDDRTYDAVVRNLEIIGEAIKHVPYFIRERYPEVDWRRIAGLRDLITHEYFGLDNDILWDVVQNQVPKLLEQVELILKKEDNRSGNAANT